MTFVFDDENVSSLPIGTPAVGGSDTGFVENFKAAKNLFKLKDKFTSRADVLEKEWQPIVDTINARTGAKLENPATQRGRFINTQAFDKKQPASFQELTDMISQPIQQKDLLFNVQAADKVIEQNSKQIFDFISKNQQALPEYKDLTLDKIYQKASQTVSQAQTTQEDIATRQTTGGLLGEFSGYAVEAFTDPINIGVAVTDIAFTKGALRGALVSEITATAVAKEALRQAVLGAGAEAVVQSEVSKWYKDLDLPYDYTTFLTNVGFAGIGAGVITGAVAGAVPAYRFTKKQMIDGVEALNKAKAKITGQPYVADEALQVIKSSAEIDDIINQQNIIPDDVGNLEHNAKVEEYIEAIDTNNITKVLTGEDIPDATLVRETVEEDLTKFDGGQSAGESEQTDILLAELRDNIKQTELKIDATKYPSIESFEGLSTGIGGVIKPTAIEIGKQLYRETNVSGLNNLLIYDKRYELNKMFVATSENLAIGQGDNKGVKIVFRKDALSGKENIKPGTAGGLGKIVGKEYQTDIVAPRAVQEIKVNSINDLKGINGPSRFVLNKEFKKVENADGSVSFVRKELIPDTIAKEEFLNRSIPVDKFDPVTKDTVQSAMTIKEIVEELEQDKMMIDRLTGCLT